MNRKNKNGEFWFIVFLFSCSYSGVRVVGLCTSKSSSFIFNVYQLAIFINVVVSPNDSITGFYCTRISACFLMCSLVWIVLSSVYR